MAIVTSMDQIYQRIYADPEFQALERRRSRFCWTLAALMLSAFFGLILLIAFAPATLAVPLGPNTVITRGFPLGVAVMVLGFVLTAVYTVRANGEFDSAQAAILARLAPPS